MNDSIGPKIVIAGLAALFAVFAKHIYEAWIRHQAWNGLSVEPELTAVPGQWALRVHNASDSPVKRCTAYITVRQQLGDHSLGVWLNCENNDTPDLIYPVIQGRIAVTEDRLAWAQQHGPSKEHHPTSDICPGEKQALQLVYLTQIVAEKSAEWLQANCNTYDGKKVVPPPTLMAVTFEQALVLPSETGYLPNPRAFLKGDKPYTLILKLVSETLPAKEFELLVDPKKPQAMVTVVRTLPKPVNSWLRQLESQAEQRSS